MARSQKVSVKPVMRNSIWKILPIPSFSCPSQAEHSHFHRQALLQCCGYCRGAAWRRHGVFCKYPQAPTVELGNDSRSGNTHCVISPCSLHLHTYMHMCATDKSGGFCTVPPKQESKTSSHAAPQHVSQAQILEAQKRLRGSAEEAYPFETW